MANGENKGSARVCGSSLSHWAEHPVSLGLISSWEGKSQQAEPPSLCPGHSGELRSKSGTTGRLAWQGWLRGGR